MAYHTEGDLENIKLQDIDSSFSTWISSVIAMVEAYIDQYTGRNFSGTSGSGTKYYDLSESDEVTVDPFTAITSVKILDIDGNTERTLETTDYFLYPLNDSLQYTIKLRSGSFPERSKGLEVIGTFGYTSVPLPVKLAAIKLSSRIVDEGLRGGQVGSESLGDYSIDYKDINDEADALGVKEILNQYRTVEMV